MGSACTYTGRAEMKSVPLQPLHAGFSSIIIAKIQLELQYVTFDFF